MKVIEQMYIFSKMEKSPSLAFSTAGTKCQKWAIIQLFWEMKKTGEGCRIDDVPFEIHDFQLLNGPRFLRQP